MAAEAVSIPGIELEAELGRGSYSRVFRARHDAQPCAVKIARHRMGANRWFRQEAVALARVKHPGIPAVMEVGETEGMPYLVMELVEGQSLAERLQPGPLSEDEVRALASQLARTLDAVHRRGLLHRDIKPQNIIIERESGRVRLVDFGFVLQLDRTLQGDDAAGTRAYAAPEQRRPPQILDARADLYALGVVLAECLLGYVPPADDLQEYAGHLRTQGTSAEFASLIGQLGAEDPERRPRNGAELVSVLEALGQHGRLPEGPRPRVLDPQPVELVGRTDELRRLSAAWREGRAGRGSTLSVEGVPGSGKSRLVHELAAQVRREHRQTAVVHVACREGEDRPAGVLRALLEGLLDEAESDQGPDSGRTRHAIETASSGHLAPLAAGVSPRLAQILGNPAVSTDVADVRGTYVEGLAEFLTRVFRELGSVLAVVDDIQWLDAVSREVLVRLVHRTHEIGLLLVVTARLDERSREGTSRFVGPLGHDRLTRMKLGPLDEDATRALVHDYLGSSDETFSAGDYARIASLSDGTPLGLLEVLRAALDSGVLRPHWGSWYLDPDRASQLSLPKGSLAGLQRRLDQITPATRHVLEVAATVGTTFTAPLLASTCGVSLEGLGYALAEAQRAGLIEPAGRGVHRFVHDRVQDALREPLPETRQRQLHQRIAESLEQSPRTDDDVLYAQATHYALGTLERTPERTFQVTRAASLRALDAFDNEGTLWFLSAAERAAHLLGRQLDVQAQAARGDAALRLGSIDDSLDAFRKALDGSADAVYQAHLWGRVAWAHQMNSDADQAWAALAKAFRALGLHLPTENAGSARRALASWARTQIHGTILDTGRGTRSRRELEVLSILHYQNARMGVEYSKPGRLLLSTVEGLDVAERLGPSAALVRSLAAYGFTLIVAGQSERAADYFRRAKQLASELEDARVYTYSLQLECAAAGWEGDLERSVKLARVCIEEYGHWLELNEYCVLISTPIAVETVRGRLRDAWSWIRRAIERVRRENRIPSAFVVIEHAARATLTALGTGSSNALSVLTRDMVRDRSDPTGYFSVITWGSRIRLHTEMGDLGERFEALVAEFEAEGHDPKKAHMSLGEFYVHLAHARIHQCLHASDADRPRRLRQLRKASADLRTAARVDVYRAHALLAEGYCCWFAGHPDSARHRLRQALELAETENTPWVVAAVARARAHMLRSEGRGDAAVDQARIAAILSREHGAAHRLRAIQEEFGLHGPSVSAFRSTLSTSASSRHRSGGSRRHLRTLLHLGRASTQELDLELQGRAVVDELIESLTADRGVLFFERDPAAGRLEMIAGRTRAGEDLPEVTPQCRQVIERVRETEQPWVLPNVDGDLGGSVTEAAGAQRALAVPLWVHGRTVGVVYLDRDPSHDPFTLADSDFFETLAYQVPVALELTRVLQERAELEESLRQSQKMEALGQLAGGIAHDFNNMLTAIEGSLMALESPECTAEERAEELQTVREATERATTLTRQLLTFARRQVLAPQVYAPNDVLRDLVSILRKLVGEHIRVRLQLQDELWEVETDRGEYEQMIVNFAVNARDAMPEGGELTIGTYNVRYEHAPARELAPGRYVCTRIADTGQGMSQEVKDKIFDPFFTTKGPGDGTGLGLTTAYGFVRQHGGHIDVSSTPGTGTVFSVYLPATDRSPDEKVVRSASMPAPASGTETILLIEDEALVRRSLRRILERVGYRVLSAENGAQALEQARRHAGQIHLIVTDVLMPGMNGPQVIERLAQLPIDAPVLYISGYTDGQLVEQGVLRQGVEFVQKPFSAQSIKERVRTLLAQGKT